MPSEKTKQEIAEEREKLLKTSYLLMGIIFGIGIATAATIILGL